MANSWRDENTSSFTISAEFAGVEESTPIYLQRIVDEGLESIDSSFVKLSKVSFTGNLEAPEMVFLKVGNTRKMVNLFAENSEIMVKVNIDKDQKKNVAR